MADDRVMVLWRRWPPIGGRHDADLVVDDVDVDDVDDVDVGHVSRCLPPRRRTG